MLDLEIPRKAARDYLRICGYTAICIITMPSGYPCILRSCRDLAYSLARARRTWDKRVEMTYACWTARPDDANRVVSKVSSMHINDYRDGTERIFNSGETLRTDIEFVSKVMQIVITDHDAVMGRISTVLRVVNSRLTDAQASGELAFFNKEFKRRRLANPKNQMLYGQARAKLRIALLKRAIAGDPKVDASLLTEIFQ